MQQGDLAQRSQLEQAEMSQREQTQSLQRAQASRRGVFLMKDSQGHTRRVMAPRTRKRRSTPQPQDAAPGISPELAHQGSHLGGGGAPPMSAELSGESLSQMCDNIEADRVRDNGAEADQLAASVFRHARRNLEFASGAAKRRRAKEAVPEPIIDMLLEFVRTPHEQRTDLLFSDAAFRGLENPAKVTQSVKSWLCEIRDDTRTYRQVAADLDYDMRTTHPLPWYTALKTFSDSQGWFPEVLSLLLDSNSGFLEHPETACTHDIDVAHRVSPSQAGMVGE